MPDRERRAFWHGVTLRQAVADPARSGVAPGQASQTLRQADPAVWNEPCLKDRLKPEYAASSEVATVLRQASRIDKFFKDKGPGTKGESEWNKLASDLKALAAAYGADFPLPENAPVRRMGDREVAVSVDAIAKTADELRKSLGQDVKKDVSVDPGARAAAITEVDELSMAAPLGSRGSLAALVRRSLRTPGSRAPRRPLSLRDPRRAAC